MNIKLLSDRILVEVLAAETETKSGLVIPKTSEQGDILTGQVVAVGEGKTNSETGTLIPSVVKEGDKVMFQYGTKITIEGKILTLVREEDVIVVLN